MIRNVPDRTANDIINSSLVEFKKWEQGYVSHVKALPRVKGMVDQDCPRSCDKSLQLSLWKTRQAKQTAIEAEIGRENRKLVDQLFAISRRNPGGSFCQRSVPDSSVYAHGKGTLHDPLRRRAAASINQENEGLVKRLMAAKPTMNLRKLEKDFQNHRKTVQTISKFRPDRANSQMLRSAKNESRFSSRMESGRSASASRLPPLTDSNMRKHRSATDLRNAGRSVASSTDGEGYFGRHTEPPADSWAPRPPPFKAKDGPSPTVTLKVDSALTEAAQSDREAPAADTQAAAEHREQSPPLQAAADTSQAAAPATLEPQATASSRPTSGTVGIAPEPASAGHDASVSTSSPQASRANTTQGSGFGVVRVSAGGSDVDGGLEKSAIADSDVDQASDVDEGEGSFASYHPSQDGSVESP
mmetsp:Transcript_106323/g.243407  ORF Transcript_106323/g.243407 Transcript_106323/m.243407 type:complete len:415 (+) Transcript_106323:105-1349(+)